MTKYSKLVFICKRDQTLYVFKLYTIFIKIFDVSDNIKKNVGFLDINKFFSD